MWSWCVPFVALVLQHVGHVAAKALETQLYNHAGALFTYNFMRDVALEDALC